MKTKLYIILIICLSSVSYSFGQSVFDNISELDYNGQTILEGAMEIMNVSINLSPKYEVSKNYELILPAGDEYTANMNQLRGYEPSSGNTELNIIFGAIHASLVHTDSKCKILINAFGEFNIRFGLSSASAKKLFNVVSYPYNRIKKDFRYGIPNKSATKEEIEELDMMVKHCPVEQAKEMFNADEMLMYPLSLRGNVLDDKFTRCRAVVVSKNELPIIFYFLMTDESVKNFDQYLKDLSGSFMYN